MKEIKELGEFGLIEAVKEKTTQKLGSTIKGIGDDCAVLEKDADNYTLVSTDMLMEAVHFDLTYVPLKHLGYKAVAVNVSDVVAMNGRAEQITIALGLSSRFTVEAVEEFYEGVHAACEAYNVDLVGGDMTSSRSGLAISVTVIGSVAKDKIAYRSGAKEKDILCTTGDLGAAFIGLQVLEREKAVFKSNPEMQPKLDSYEYMVGKQLKPEAQVGLVDVLAEKGVVPTAMIDISDGLASEALHIAQASNLGAVLFEEKIPIDDAGNTAFEDFSLSAVTCALNGGEDYEILFAVSHEDYPKIENVEGIHAVGYLQDAGSGSSLILRSGEVVALQAQGWNHFNKEEDAH